MKPEIEFTPINPNEYKILQLESSNVCIGLARCIDNNYVTEIPEALAMTKSFLNKFDIRLKEMFRRPLDILHSILITRMYFNRTFRSPLYSHNLDALRTYPNSEVEFRNIYALYINAIEESLVKEA